MQRTVQLTALALLVLTAPAHSQSVEQKIIRLEQDVRRLERLVQSQADIIRQLQYRLGQTPATSTPRIAMPAPASGHDAAWLSSVAWQGIQPGMKELDVIGLLGPPNSVRLGEDNSRILLYALELGTTHFLSGSVTLRDGSVVSVQVPTLR